MIALRTLQYIDLALKTERDPGVKLRPDGTADADWFVIATAARIHQLVYLLDIYRAQLPFPSQVGVIKQQHRFWKSWKIGIESNAFQAALAQSAWDKGLPVIEVPSTSDKVVRAQLVTPHFQSGRVRIRGVVENGMLVCHPIFTRFLQEAQDFPYGDHDDVVDAIVGVVQMCMDEELMGRQLEATIQSGFAFATVGGSRKGDPYDVFRSQY